MLRRDSSLATVWPSAKACGLIAAIVVHSIGCGGQTVGDIGNIGGAEGGGSSGDGDQKSAYCGPITGTPKIIGPLTGAGMNMVADSDAVYWCEEEGRGRVEPVVVRWDIATGKLRSIAKARCGMLIGDGEYLYFSNSAQQLGRIAKDGSSSKVLFQANLPPGGGGANGWYDLTVDENYVYWTDFREGGGIYRGSKLGGASELLVEERMPTGLAVDQDAVYWMTRETGLKKRSKSTGEIVTISTERTTGGLGSSNLQLDGGFVYWVSSRGLERAPKNGGSPTLLVARDYSVGVYSVSIQAGCLYFGSGTKLYRRPLTEKGEEVVVAKSTRDLNIFWYSANERGVFWTDWEGFEDKGEVYALTSRGP